MMTILHSFRSGVCRAAGAAVIAAVVTVALSGCQSTPATGPNGARLYSGFGNYTRAASTDSAEAQKWFNQGMQLLYGFNHDEAIRSFHAAAACDDTLAIAWWGIAYAHGLHINNPEMSEQQSRLAYEASQEATARVAHASPVEAALIRAVAARYAWPVPADRKPLDMAYADAMQEVWRAFGNDPDVGALYAESLMNLQPWDLWTREGQPKGRTLEIVATLERVMAMSPNHPGANHFYVHAMEASPEPEKAVVSADRLRTLVPGSGHLVHMPAHIYARLGRWADASDSNVEAVKVDRAYFKMAPPPDFYALYFVHNLHFLSWSAMMEGRHEVAMRAARELEADIPEEFLRNWPQFADGFMPTMFHVMIRFGKWEEILREPEPEAFRRFSRTIRHYARGVALSAMNRTAEARVEQEAFEREAALVPSEWMVGQNAAGDVIAIARQMLMGELLYREGDHERAFAELRAGAALEERLVYDEPPGWMQPVRHALGALLMSVGRHAEAEQVYRDDLALNRHNGWAMLGLEQALRAQGKATEAAAVVVARSKVWSRADVQPRSSCYCEPGV